MPLIRLNKNFTANLGKQGENNVTQIEIDVSDFQTEFPNGYPLIYIRRRDGECYPIATELDEDVATAWLSALDTAIRGDVQIECHWLEEEKLKKSAIFKGNIERALEVSDTEPTPLVSTWVEMILAQIPQEGETGQVLTKRQGYNEWANVVNSVNGAQGNVTITASMIHALPDTTVIPQAVSQLRNDTGYITHDTEWDPTVPSWAKQPTKPTYTAAEVGALPNTTHIPSKTSDLTNDSGFITESSIPTSLSQLDEDSTHQTVTAAQKSEWSAKADAEAVPDALAELTEDAQHRTVTDAEKAAWNNKYDMPEGGTVGQVLTKTETGTEWADPQGGGSSKEVTINCIVELGVTLSTSNGNRTTGDRGVIKDYIPVDGLVRIDVIPNDRTQTYAHGYRVFEYGTDDSFLGYTKVGSWYWPNDNQSVFTPDMISHEGVAKLLVLVDDQSGHSVSYVKSVTSTKELEEKIEAVQDNISRRERLTNARDMLNVAYSHIYLAPANTMEHFLTAARLNFNALKCDCRLTSDGGIILCHDAGYTLNADGRITSYSAGNSTAIHNMTVAQCKALEFEPIYYLNDHYAHPCELKDFLSVCKEYKKIPFITLRDSYTEETAAVILVELDKFGLRDVAIINSIKPITNLEIMRSLDKHIAMNFVIDHEETLTNAYVDAVNALGNCSISMFSLPADTTDTVYDASLPAVRYAQSLGLTVQNAQITNYSDYRKMVDDGFSGLQLTRAILPMPISTVPFKVTVSGGVGTISGMFKWTVPYTADISVSSDGVTVRNIAESGSARGFVDGLMPLWMNQFPYTIDVVSESGRNCTAKWHDNALVIDTDNANDVYDVCVTFGRVETKESTVPAPTDDEYRLISEFTADGTNSLIVRNLALKNVLVHIHATAASEAGNVTVALTTNTNVELQGYVKNAINTSDRFCMVKADREHGRFFVTQTAAGATNDVAAVSTRVNTLDGNVAAAYIKTVSIAKVFPEGSTIKVYGIDA